MQNRHLAETQILLEESRSKYAQLYEQCPAGLLTIELTGRILQANATAAELLGLSQSRLLGHIFARFVAFEDRAQFLDALRTCLRGRSGIKSEVEVTLRAKNNRLRMHISMHQTLFVGNPVPAVSLSMVDVTKQYALAQRECFIAAVGEQFGRTLDLDAETNTLLNMAVPRLADFAALFFHGENLLSEAASEKFRYQNDARVWCSGDVEKISSILQQSELQKNCFQSAQSFDWRPECSQKFFTDEQAEHLSLAGVGEIHAWPLGRRGQVLATLFLAWSNTKDKQALAVGSVMRDFVHRAALSLDNVNLYRIAQRQIKARSEFLAIVAHDLRNPLTVISMRAERLMLKEKASNASFTQKSAEVIGRCVQRMGALVRDLLDATSMDKSSLSMSPQIVKVQELIDDELNVHLPLMAHKGLTFSQEIETCATVYCDPRRINQVLENLLGNALKYTDAGGQISFSVKSNDNQVTFCVRDTGKGMSEAAIAHVFEPFWQENAAANGVGLGLNICKKILTASGGKIWCESSVGDGSAFYFTLPIHSPISDVPAKTLASGSTVLIVDDDQTYRDNLSEILVDQGYQVACAENGKCAMDWIHHHGAPRLILLDLQMPVMDGLTFLQQRAANDALKVIPVTVMSAAVGEIEVAETPQTRVLCKMTPMEDVLRAVATC